jgi:hypothetical protein
MTLDRPVSERYIRRHMKSLRSAWARFSAGAVVVGLLAGSVAGTAKGEFKPPPVPPIHVHLPKAQETAVFNVVVEGKATDELESQLAGKILAGCDFNEQGWVNENTTYRRGRGLKLQFDRYGKEALVHRVGRETDATLGVQLATTRWARGGSQITPTVEPPCQPEPQHLDYHYSKNPDCGQTVHGHGVALFTYIDDRFGLSVIEKPKRQPDSFGTCGLDPSTGLTLEFQKAWPTPPKLDTEYLPLSSVFGHRPVIKIDLGTIHNLPITRRFSGGSGPGLEGSLVETPNNEVTIRLIRVGHGKGKGKRGGKHH